MSQITLLLTGAFIFGVGLFAQVDTMLFLAAITRLAEPRQAPSNDLLVESRLGHLGLTVIALIYVLVTLWQQ